jgi:hypothetical protein
VPNSFLQAQNQPFRQVQPAPPTQTRTLNPSLSHRKVAKVRIVAEVYLPRDQDYEFWMEAPGRRERIVDAMRKTGARVIVDDKVPKSALGEGWLRVGKTGYGLLFLRNAPTNASR